MTAHFPGLVVTSIKSGGVKLIFLLQLPVKNDNRQTSNKFLPKRFRFGMT